MENSNHPDNFNEEKKQLNSYVKYTGMAFQMMAIIGIFAFIGYKLDIWLRNEVQWITALSCILGICISLYQTIRQLKQ